MFRKRSDLPWCSNCENNTEMVNPRPAVDRRGRTRINWHGLQATSWNCSNCGSEENDALWALWQDWRVMLGVVTMLFFMGWCGFGVYLFGYWSWRDAGGFTGWPMGSYVWTAFAGGCGLMLGFGLSVGMCISLRYLWVRWVRVKRAES